MADIDQQRARQDYERGQLAVDVYRPKNERGVEGWDIESANNRYIDVL